MIDVLYFASLREQLGCAQESFDTDPVLTRVGDLRQRLAARGSQWSVLADTDHHLLVAVNQQMADDSTLLSDGDEVAFFPPVTGG